MKRVAFLYDFVSGLFYDNRTHGRDRQATTNADAIAEQIGYRDNIVEVVGELLAYTNELEFRWPEGTEVPDSFKSLERFWSMYKQGLDLGKCFQYFSDNVDNMILIGATPRYKLERMTDEDIKALTTGAGVTKEEIVSQDGVIYKSRLETTEVKGWNRALNEALKSWTPPDSWKLLQNLPEEQRSDPKS